MSRNCSTTDQDWTQPPLSRPADAIIGDIRRLALRSEGLDIDAATLMGERAALMRLPLPGRIAAGGAAHILDCRDGAIALNLPRESDWELLPALFELDDAGQLADWRNVAHQASSWDADALVDRARLLGMACARADLLPTAQSDTVSIRRFGQPRLPGGNDRPLVIDLSALWAGPLCGHLLERGGARVIKVESPDRPDGARRSNAGFYGLLNQGKLCLSLDLSHRTDRDRLLTLIERADIVIESSRARALRHYGVDAERLASRPGFSWIAISAYGRGHSQEDWIGFGDDVAAAAGLCAAMRDATGELAFVGDAAADPITGIVAAQTAWRCWREGGGVLASVAMRDATSSCLDRELEGDRKLFYQRLAQFRRTGYAFRTPRLADQPVYPLGAHDAWPIEALMPC